MLGLSYGEIFLILGATAALIGPKDLPIIARTAGRLAGRAIGYVQLARGQFENAMQQTQFRQVNKELQDTMAQLEAIRYEIRSFSIMNPGPLTQRLMDYPDQAKTETGTVTDTGPSTVGTAEAGPHPAQHKQNYNPQNSFRAETSVFKEHPSTASVASNLYSQATTYARLAESQAVKGASVGSFVSVGAIDDKPGHLTVLPVSAESAGLLSNRQGKATGSDIVLEAILEAEVARNAKEFFSQPENQIKSE